MNYFNPYYYSMPTNFVQPKIGLLGKLFGNTGLSISNFLNGTQRILNIANQTIPLVKQAKPMFSNAKTMFKVMNEFKKADSKIKVHSQETIKNEIISENISNEKQTVSNEGPIFFI